MTLRVPFTSLATLVVFVLCLGPARAGFPPLPGVPGIPSVKQATTAVVSKQLVKQMGDEFNLEQPLRLSADAEYPTTATLPGASFHPAKQHVVAELYAHAHDGHVRFAAGDYAISVFTYCMMAHEHVPMRNKFRLTPIQGKWADIASALFARTSYGYNRSDVQVLTWSLLAGMKYSELSAKSQHLVDTVLPEFKPRLQMSFYEKLQQRWTQISANVPGVPSFDAALGQMGDVGKAIIKLRDMRDELVNNASNYDEIVRQFATIGVARVPGEIAPTSWSILAPGVYARMLDKAGYLTPGVLQLRVTRQAVAAEGVQVASVGRGWQRAVAAKVVALGIPLPTTGFAGYPGAAVQALGWSPEPGDAPDPGVPGSGGSPGGSGSAPAPGEAPSPSGTEPSSTPRPGETPGDTGGGGHSGSGSGSGSRPASGTGDDPGDTSSPCDPPDNEFGVDKGTLLSDSASGMNLGRTKKSHGIVCLLLRPFVELAPVGWPTRGGATVDFGSASYTLFGHAAPGQVIITAHYTYATTSTLTDPYVKKHITAVIAYGAVTAFCPELVSTIKGNGTQSIPGWLSGAELENRMCIAGMLGQTMPVSAWVVDGDFTGSETLAHQVDPENFLYADSTGHM